MEEISFDDFHRIRVLEQNKYKDSEELQNQCTQFVSKLTQFSKSSTTVLNVVSAKSEEIEEEKLKAIRKRNQVESQSELRRRKQRELLALVSEKQAELERYVAEYESLLKVELEQKVLLDKLSNNEA
eukprot:TRINITY_DN1019_c0_g1_i10.p1 TRINITY_DN1019_c0_g1~~TRINITY_DN1019_c0_g1_i10.p1  ORF type:complete len:127 (-),score=31.37 TRINITY_DN1019_c0_g1_i10:392-772(-)